MSYSGSSDSKLPSYVKSKPEPMRARWVSLFNSTETKEGKEVALIVANKWLKRQKVPLKRSLISFAVEESEGVFLKRSLDDGEDYVTLKLGSSESHGDGKKYSPSVLQKWANWINSGNSIVGDIDHEEYDRLVSGFYTDQDIRISLKNKPSIAKAIKAVYENGILWIKAAIDKRYSSLIKKSKGVSAEALVSYGENQTIDDGDLLGFTFNVHTTPADPGAGVVA